jgi:arylamine N-acetyltransferase
LKRISQASSLFLDLYNIRPKDPGLALLGEISHQFANLPWENLTKFIKKHQCAELPDQGGERDPAPAGNIERLRRSEEVIRDHARQGAGGTCFSLTNALRRIVADLGFKAYPVMADMKHGPNIHCGLLVELNGRRHLLDPGYLVPEPVSLDPSRASIIRLPGYRLEYRPDARSTDIELYMINDRGEESFRYRLRPRAVPETDFVRFWLQSFDAPGMNSLHLNRVTSAARLSAHGINLRVDRGRDKTNIKLRDDYARQIASQFGLAQEIAQRAFQEWERQRCLR